jgi:hypothetical protein
MPFIFAVWVGRRVESGFAINGALVGVVAALIYMGLAWALVADAAGNSLLVVDRRGNIDWVATVPDQVVDRHGEKDLRVS